MKNFDIENLERKNIYEVPDDFFAKMQENVLKATVETTPLSIEEAPAKKKNWWYAAAAAVAVLLGSAFFLNREAGASDFAQNNAPAKHAAGLTQEKSNQKTAVQKSVAADNYHTLVADLTSVEKENQTREQPEVVAQKKTVTAAKTAHQKNEAPVEQILEGMTEEDLNMLAQNTEQDIYLDLYN